jgi:hypothetical protein
MLDEAQTHALRLHWETCAACETERAQLARIREALLRVPEPPLPAEFDAGLRRALASLSESAPADTVRNARGARAFSGRRLRLWSSVAAVFAIGLLSLFAYNNTVGQRFDLTPSSGGGAESAAVARPAEGGFSEDGASDGGFSAGAEESESAAAPEESAPETLADEAKAASAEGERADEDYLYVSDALADISTDDAAPARTYEDVTEAPASYERYERPGGYPARGTTTAGAHRLNEKALYDEMLKERLAGWIYEILWEEKRDGAYVYRVNMIRNESGMTFNQEIEAVASGNALQIYYASEFMGL